MKTGFCQYWTKWWSNQSIKWSLFCMRMRWWWRRSINQAKIIYSVLVIAVEKKVFALLSSCTSMMTCLQIMQRSSPLCCRSCAWHSTHVVLCPQGKQRTKRGASWQIIHKNFRIESSSSTISFAVGLFLQSFSRQRKINWQKLSGTFRRSSRCTCSEFMLDAGI